jgi:hypothetical protein
MSRALSPRDVAIQRLQRPPVRPGGRVGPAPVMGGLYGPTPAPGSDGEAKVPWYATTAYKVFLGVTDIAAMALSYERNKSIPWAIAHGFGPVGPVYLAYRGVQALKGSGNRGVRDYSQMSVAQLRGVMEDGYGDQRAHSYVDAQAAADEAQNRVLTEGEWQSLMSVWSKQP